MELQPFMGEKKVKIAIPSECPEDGLAVSRAFSWDMIENPANFKFIYIFHFGTFSIRKN